MGLTINLVNISYGTLSIQIELLKISVHSRKPPFHLFCFQYDWDGINPFYISIMGIGFHQNRGIVHAFQRSTNIEDTP